MALLTKNVMDKGHQAASPVVGPSTNIPAKLKPTNSFTDSPNSNSCNACHSPSQSIIGSTNRTMSPYASYNTDAKSDDVVLPKNGTKLLHGPSTSPYFPNESSPVLPSCTSPSTTAASGAWSHGNNNSKRTYNKFGGRDSPGETMSTSRTANRTDKNSSLMNSDQVPHAMLSRSRSVNIGMGNTNNINSNVARRMCSVDSHNHKDGTSNRNVNSMKFPDQNQLRHSPRTNYVNEGRAQSESPFGACPPTSFDSGLPVNPVKGKLRSDSVSTPTMRLNHLMSRTSSSNSISDLSPCSTEENSTKLNKTSSLALDSLPSSTVFTPVCNSTSDAITDLNIDENNLLSTLGDDINIDSLQNDELSSVGLDAFEFSNGGNGQDDIGSNALNLSAEEVQQTLNSVSALPDITLGCTSTDGNQTASDMSDKVQTDIENILSSATTSSCTTTATSSSVETISSKLLTPTLDPITGSFSDNCSTSTSALTTTTTSYSSPGMSGSSTKSHLQEILGTADTNRLKNMSRPIDPSQYSSPTTTSFTNFNNPSKNFTGQMSSTSDRPTQAMSVTSPSGISPRPKFTPGGGPPFPQRMLHRTASTPQQMPSLHNYELNHSPFEHPSKFPHEHALPIGSRPGMPFEPSNIPSHPMHDGGQFGLPSSSQGTWQRSHSTSGVMGPHGVDGSKSPRGFGSSYPSKPINPMSGLQNTVDAIPNMSMLMKNNNNNMGPPHSNQRIPTPGVGMIEGPLSIDSRTMLPPPSPLTHDKRSVSADGSVTIPGISKTKGNKRERGQSLDSKDGDKKEPGAKKRKKSKSKDEGRKADSRVGQRSGFSAEPQNSHFHLFNTDLANAAAAMVHNGTVHSIIHHHANSVGNSRLFPSKTSLTSNQQNSVKSELNSPHSALTSSASVPASGRVDVKPFSQSVPVSTTPNHMIKSEGPTSRASTPAGTHVNAESKQALTAVPVKAEGNSDPTKNSFTDPSPSAEPPKKDDNLTDEQRKHRKEQLIKLETLKSKLLPSQAPPSNPESWPSTSAHNNNNYSMTRFLQKVQETNKDSATSEGASWFRLVQAYNEERRRKSRMLNNSLENSEPPPYNTAPPTHINPRWMPGHPTREPGPPSSEIPNARFPHHGIPGSIRLPHDGTRFYGSSRFPRHYISSGPSSRMSMYSGPNMPPGSMIPRSSVPRLPPTHGMVPTNEAYPFSEKLKEQASMYRTEGMHNQGVPIDFEVNPGEPMVGPRMNSPEWSSYGNAPNAVPINRNMGPIPPEGLSPSCSGIGSAPINPNPMIGHMESGMPPSIESMGPTMPMQMNNPGMGPNFNMTSYPNKAPGNLSSYSSTSMAGGKSYPTQEMRSSANPPMDGSSGMMGDTMARRGEPRPPDLNIHPNISRSPPTFQGGRHTMPSPGMTSNPGMYVGGEPGYHQGGLPHMSPHPANIPRSPMMNSPNLMKSPMGGMHLNIKMGMGPMEQATMMQAGPRSAGPAGGLSSDWNNMTQPSGHPSRIQQSVGTHLNNPSHKPAIQQMIDGVNRFQLPNNVLYQNEVKDSISPQPLSHIIDNPGMPPEASSIGQPRIEGPVAPGNVPMMRHSGYDSGPRSAGSRIMGPMMAEGFGPEFNRPPSHSGMCMSPGAAQAGAAAQAMGQPGMMDTMHRGPGFISQSSMLPSSDVPPSGVVPPRHPGVNQASNVQRFPPEFDLSGMFPSEKPSETLSYFPPNGGSAQDTSQMVPNQNMNIAMRSPPMTQQTTSRYPSMGQRPMTPGTPSYTGNNSSIRMPGPGNFLTSNPPGYPVSGGEDYMSPPWETVPRPQMMQSSGSNMHPNFPRPLI